MEKVGVSTASVFRCSKKKQQEEWRAREDADNYIKRALAPHLSPQNLRTDQIEERIVAMSEAEWQELLELVCAPYTRKDYHRIRGELLAKRFGGAP